MSRHYWTSEEEDFISQLIGYYPVKKIVSMVRKNFTLEVSDLAIKAKVEKVARGHGEKIRDRVDNYSMSAVARFLGINNIIVWRWLASGLQARKVGELWLIKHSNLVQFAKDNPRRCRQVPRAGLEWLFNGDMTLVNLVKDSKPLKPLRPVLCVTTGKVYPSLRSIELELSISRDRIKTYIESGLPTRVEDKYLMFRWAD